MRFDTVAIMGMGLLGGSLGLAIRDRGLARRIIGVGRNIEKLSRAKELGTCDEVTTDPAQGFLEADLVVLCTPVTILADSLPELIKYFKPRSIVTDVGSTKRRIVEVADLHMPPEVRFVGSHPMSGGEVSGVEHSRMDLYLNNPCFLTPTAGTDLEALAVLNQFWRMVGSRIIITDPVRHDRLVSAISHVPHFASAALTLLAADMNEEENFVASSAGNGFWGMTRLAKGDLTMWSEICSENREEICQHMDRLIQILGELRRKISEGTQEEFLQKAREFRLELDQLRPQGQ